MAISKVNSITLKEKLCQHWEVARKGMPSGQTFEEKVTKVLFSYKINPENLKQLICFLEKEKHGQIEQFRQTINQQ